LDDYITWLRHQGVRLFEAGGQIWRTYKGAVVPASTVPSYIELSPKEQRRLLRASGAWFLRYSSSPCDAPTEWWYVVCDRYDPAALSSKTRNKINRGLRAGRVTLIEPEWLAQHGYSCYLAAHGRYGGASPVSEDAWRRDVLASVGGPFEYWGVFIGQSLAGYCKCVLEANNVATTVGKYDPAYFKDRPVNALVGRLIEHYVGSQKRSMSNGHRAILHDTGMQEFLMDHGFRRQFCRLNIAYRRLLGIAVRVAYPLRGALVKGEGNPLGRRLGALVTQEGWRRSFQESASRPSAAD